jgi:hypothetical protein
LFLIFITKDITMSFLFDHLGTGYQPDPKNDNVTLDPETGLPPLPKGRSAEYRPSEQRQTEGAMLNEAELKEALLESGIERAACESAVEHFFASDVLQELLEQSVPDETKRKSLTWVLRCRVRSVVRKTVISLLETCFEKKPKDKDCACDTLRNEACTEAFNAGLEAGRRIRLGNIVRKMTTIQLPRGLSLFAASEDTIEFAVDRLMNFDCTLDVLDAVLNELQQCVAAIPTNIPMDCVTDPVGVTVADTAANPAASPAGDVRPLFCNDLKVKVLIGGFLARELYRLKKTAPEGRVLARCQPALFNWLRKVTKMPEGIEVIMATSGEDNLGDLYVTCDLKAKNGKVLTDYLSQLNDNPNADYAAYCVVQVGSIEPDSCGWKTCLRNRFH